MEKLKNFESLPEDEKRKIGESLKQFADVIEPNVSILNKSMLRLQEAIKDRMSGKIDHPNYDQNEMRTLFMDIAWDESLLLLSNLSDKEFIRFYRYMSWLGELSLDEFPYHWNLWEVVRKRSEEEYKVRTGKNKRIKNPTFEPNDKLRLEETIKEANRNGIKTTGYFLCAIIHMSLNIHYRDDVPGGKEIFKKWLSEHYTKITYKGSSISDKHEKFLEKLGYKYK